MNTENRDVLPDLITTKKASSFLLKDIYGFLKNASANRISRWRAKADANELHQKLKRYRMVKTILNLEKAVDLRKFYFPMSVSRSEKPIRSVDDLNFSGGMIIVGTVGQGKSIFMRYLASREIVLKTGKIPVFVELRNKRKRTLKAFLDTELQLLGLRMTPSVFTYFANNGRFVFFLDGFDELDEDVQPAVAEEINEFVRTHESCKLIVATRPGSAIRSSEIFQETNLKRLLPNQCLSVIGRIGGEELAEAIKTQLDETGTAIEKILTTPLMVALLVVRFKIESTVPVNELAFFSDLLDLLFRRHDQAKGGYRRRRKSKLGDHDLTRIFYAICFLTRKYGTRREFSLKQLNKFAHTACHYLNIPANEDAVSYDIINITNLIFEEAGTCRFVHKSVQEFHAACFVEDIGGEFAKKFYRSALLKGGWLNELVFLKQLDKRGFEECYLLPATDYWLRKRKFGYSWLKDVLGYDEHFIVDQEQYHRNKSILAGYMQVSAERSPEEVMNEMRLVHKSVLNSVKTFKSMAADFDI